MSLIQLIKGLMPANQSLDWMDVKEKSEIMEGAREAAAYHVKLYFKAAKDYEAVCKRYEIQCMARKY